jgi:hypothetical protein
LEKLPKRINGTMMTEIEKEDFIRTALEQLVSVRFVATAEHGMLDVIDESELKEIEGWKVDHVMATPIYNSDGSLDRKAYIVLLRGEV